MSKQKATKSLNEHLIPKKANRVKIRDNFNKTAIKDSIDPDLVTINKQSSRQY